MPYFVKAAEAFDQKYPPQTQKRARRACTSRPRRAVRAAAGKCVRGWVLRSVCVSSLRAGSNRK